MSYSKQYAIQDIWVKYIENQPEENKGYLYTKMFEYRKTGRKEESPDETLSFLYDMMRTSVSLSMAGRKGNKKGLRNNPSGKAKEPIQASYMAETNQNLSKTIAEPDQNLTKTNISNYQQVTGEEPTKKEKENVSSPNTLSSKRKKKEIYKESRKEISATEQAFIDEFARHFPRAMRMQKPLTYSEFCTIRESIVSGGCTTEEANRVITNGMERLENDPQLNKRYISANLVIQNWLRRGFLSVSYR